MRIVKFALSNPYWVIVFTLMAGILGLVSMTRLPKDLLPTFKTSAVQVVTFYPGMPAEVMEKDITTRLERWTGQSNGIEHQESKSMIGVSIVKDFFRPDIDPNTAMSQVTSFAMSDLFYLPPGTIPPMVMPFDPTASVPLALVTVQNPDMNESKLYDIAYFSLRNMLQGISGVITPAVYGGKLRRILAYLDPTALRDRNLSSLDIVQSLKESNVLIPTGNAKLGAKDIQIVTDAMVNKVEDMNQFPIRAREGVEIKMGDVARVEDSHQIQTNIVHVNGKKQVYIPVYRQPGANTLDVIDGIKNALALILERLPKGMKLDIVADQSIFVRRSIRSLTSEVILGGLLSGLMILLFLRSWRSSFIVFLSIPVSILLCFLGLYVTGHTLNAMTLGGLALAVGRLIDDSIVVLENITRYTEQGMPPGEAALQAAGEVALPVLSATVTTVIVFLPVYFLTGIGKFLFSPLALAVTFSIGASYLVSLSLIPVFSSRFMGAHKPEPHNQPKGESWYDAFVRSYQAFLKLCLRHRSPVILAALAGLIGSLFLYPKIGKELFPAADVGHLTLHLRMPTGTRIELSEEKAAELEKRLTEVIEPSALKIVITNIGVLNDWPAAYTPNSGPGDMFMEIELNDKRKYSTQQYAEKLRGFLAANYPELEAGIDTGGMLTAALNMGLASPVNIQVAGNDLKISGKIAEDLVNKIKRIPGARDVSIQERLDYPQVSIELNRKKIAYLGLTVEEVVKNIVTALNSSINFSPAFWIDPKNGNHYFLGAQYPEKLIENLDTIKNIDITGKHQDRVIALREIANFKEITAPSEIRHMNIARAINIFAGASGRDLGSIAEDIRKILPGSKDLPEGYRINMRGEVQSMEDAFKNLGFGLLLAIILVYLVLSGQFRSFADPFLILFAVPLGLAGVLLTLWLTHTSLNIQSFLGIIFMVGISVSNSILLIDFANRELEKGTDADEAIIIAARIRLRPILMTSLATVLGLLPMAIGIGHGSEANAPLGRAVLGGISASTILVLIVIPMFYSSLQRLKKIRNMGSLILLLSIIPFLQRNSMAENLPSRPLTLEEATTLALQNNPLIRAAESEIQGLESDIVIARSPVYPRLTVSAMDSGGLGGASSAIGITGIVNSPYRKNSALGLDASWNVYDFGRVAYRTQAAREKMNAVRANLDEIKRKIRLETAEAYFRTCLPKSRQAILKDHLNDEVQIIREMDRYVHSGLRSPVELNLAKGTLEGLQASREEMIAREELAKEDLRNVMAVSDIPEVECLPDLSTGTPPLLPLSEYIQRAVGVRPELISARSLVSAAEQERIAAERENYPVLSAVASAGLLSDTSLVEKKEWSAGVGLRLPVFEGFRLTAGEKKAVSARDKFKFILLVREQDIAREVRKAFLELSGLRRKRLHLDEEEKLVKSAYQLARQRYFEKTGTFADLRDAQNMYFQTSEQSLRARYEELLAIESLNIVSGK